MIIVRPRPAASARARLPVRVAWALAFLGWLAGCGGDGDQNGPPLPEGAPPPPAALDSAAATVTLLDSAARDSMAGPGRDSVARDSAIGDTASDTASTANPAAAGVAAPDTLIADSRPGAGPMIEPPREASVARDTAWTIGTLNAPPSVGYAPLPVLTAMRTGSHPGYDRVTLELGQSEGLPAYHLEYVDRPLTECGSGRQIDPVGDAWLELRLEPAGAHTEAGQPTLGAREIVVGAPLVQRIYRTCDFEGVVTLVLALSAPNPFRVLTLADPWRVVVDIQR